MDVKEILLKQMTLLQERSEKKSELQDITEASKAMAHLADVYMTLLVREDPVYISAAASDAVKACTAQ